MKLLTIRLAAALLLLSFIPITAGAQSLVPVGEVVGLELRNGCVTVAALEEGGSAAKAAGLQPGDVILSIDGHTVSCGEDVRTALARSHGSVSHTGRQIEKVLDQLREMEKSTDKEITATKAQLEELLAKA